jgi:hypothetical protein
MHCHRPFARNQSRQVYYNTGVFHFDESTFFSVRVDLYAECASPKLMDAITMSHLACLSLSWVL